MVWNGTNFDTLGKIQLIVIEKLVKTQDPLVSESRLHCAQATLI